MHNYGRPLGFRFAQWYTTVKHDLNHNRSNLKTGMNKSTSLFSFLLQYKF